MEGLELVEEVNRLLKEYPKEYPSLDSVSDKLGISRKTIRKRCEKIGYTYNKEKKRYENIKVLSEEYSKNNTEVIEEVALTKVLPEEYNNSNIEIIEDNINIIPKEFEGLQKEDIYNLKVLLNNIDKLVDLVSKKHIVLDLPLETTPLKTTINVNGQIWADFLRKCDELRYYDKKDLISLALQDFIKNY